MAHPSINNIYQLITNRLDISALETNLIVDLFEPELMPRRVRKQDSVYVKTILK